MYLKLIFSFILIVGFTGCDRFDSGQKKKKVPDPRQSFLKEFSGKEEVEGSGYYGKSLQRMINEDGTLRSLNKVNSRCSISMTGHIHSVEWQFQTPNVYFVKYIYTNMNHFVKPCSDRDKNDYTCGTEIDACYATIAQYQSNLGVLQTEVASTGQSAKFLRMSP